MPEEFKVRFTGDDAGFGATATRAASALNVVANTAQRITGVLGAAFSARALLETGRAAAAAADDLEALSGRSDFSTRKLERLEYVATQNSASIGEMVNSVRKLAISSQEALGGNQELLAAFNGMGVSIDDLKSKDLEGLWDQVTRAIQRVEVNQASLTNITRILGKSSDALIPAMKAGFDTLEAASFTTSQRAQENLSKLDDAFGRFARSARKLRQEFFGAIGGVGADVLNIISLNSRPTEAAPVKGLTAASAAVEVAEQKRLKQEEDLAKKRAEKLADAKRQLDDLSLQNYLGRLPQSEQLRILQDRRSEFLRRANALPFADQEGRTAAFTDAERAQSAIQGIQQALQKTARGVELDSLARQGQFVGGRPIEGLNLQRQQLQKLDAIKGEVSALKQEFRTKL